MLLKVAPLVGAWIEIHESAGRSAGTASLPSWERGLKSYKEKVNHVSGNRRSPRGSVD